MKKLLLLLIALSMVLGLCGCCTCDCTEQLASLQQEVSSLKEQLDKQKDTVPAESTPIETTPVESAPIESIPIESVSADDIDIALLEVLTNQANSNNYNQCCAVAECEYATEDHLKAVANYAVTNGKSDLASKVIDNPNTTSAVMEKLSTSTGKTILLHVAESSKANETSLLNVASYAVTNGNSALASKVIDNPNTTSAVMEKLSTSKNYNILLYVAKSSKANETSLLNTASYAVDYGKTDLAAKVIDNPNTTLDVLVKLSTSSYSDVANMAHEAIEQLHN